MKGVLRAGFMTAAAIFMAGCDGSGVDTAEVKGKVTVAGQPVEGITVLFSGVGRPASGITDSSGNFTLTTIDRGDGAVPGQHQVSFTKAASGEPPSSDLAQIPAPEFPFNAKYSNPDTSEITADVVDGKVNEFTWDLEK